MDMSFPTRTPSLHDSPGRIAMDRRLDRLKASIAAMRPEEAWGEFEGLHLDIARGVGLLKAELLDVAMAWSDDEKARAAWIHATHQRFATLGSQLSELLGRKLGMDDARTLAAIATTLFYAGEVVKSEIAAGSPASHDFARVHLLMRQAIAIGQDRHGMQVDVGGRHVTCTIETLYFRALLLARFASGTLSSRQVEVLDAWLFMWSPALRGVSEAPDPSALRADLDSRGGLRRGARGDKGPCLYLPHAPIARAYEAVLELMQSGHMVPADGSTAGFRVEEHIAVLDLVRRGLRVSLGENGVRAERHPVNAAVELFVGLGEITARGYAGGGDAPKRGAMLLNASTTGLALEGESQECSGISAGDIVAVRTGPDKPLELGKVVRSVASATPGRTIIGVRRMSAAGRLAIATDTSIVGKSAHLQMIFVAGEDETGRHDSCLVSEPEYERRAGLEAHLGDSIYSFRFDRVRERGRGWVLAGFRVESVRQAAPATTT